MHSANGTPLNQTNQNNDVSGSQFLEYVVETRLPQDPKGIYTGQVDNDNKKQGTGVKIFKNGDKYDGEWRNDKSNGKGKYWTAAGDFYDGYWQDDKA